MQAKARGAEGFCLRSSTGRDTPCKSTADSQTLRLPLPPVELSVPTATPEQGARTEQLKIVSTESGAQQATMVFEGLGSTSFDLPIRLNRPRVSARGAEISGGKLRLRFPEGNGYQSKTITFTW